MKGDDNKFVQFTAPTLKAFLKARSQNVSGKKQQLVARATGRPKTYFFHELAIFWSAEDRCKEFFFPILHHLSPVISANATVVTFLPLRSSRFNFHCYTQREPMPPQKSARKWQLRPFATSSATDYERHSLLQTNIAELPNSGTLLTIMLRK